jgi:hypothetical protein
MSCTLTAIDVENFAGDEGGVLEIEGTVDDVGDAADAILRMHAGVLLVGIDAGVHGRVDDAGRYRVDPNPLPAYSTASDLVTATRPPLVSAVNADGTAE